MFGVGIPEQEASLYKRPRPQDNVQSFVGFGDQGSWFGA